MEKERKSRVKLEPKSRTPFIRRPDTLKLKYMNKTLIIIGIVVVVGFLIFKFGLKSSESDLKNVSRPNDSNRSTTPIENDKIIVVKNLKLDYLKKAIEQYCNMANQQQFTALPRLLILKNQFVILFPYDIGFDQFCYFVNYLKYAHELSLKPDYKPEIKAWCTTKSGFIWMTDEIVNKNVMIYIPDSDKEYDNVYLTTQDNFGYKMGFAMGEEHQKLDKPVINFDKMTIDLNTLKDRETIDFK
jgi:hypothetical protein